MKRTKIRYAVFCLAIALVMCVVQLGSVIADVRPAAGAATGAADTQTAAPAPSIGVQDEGVVRPEDLDEGLSRKSLQDIRGRRVTVRQPVMEVTNYEVERPKDVKVLEDTYYLGDFTTRTVLHEDAKVTFSGEEGNAKAADPKYPMKGLANSPKNGEGEQKYFSCFEKYMLLRQAYYFNTHAMDIVKEGKLAKHPAADYIYGQIPADAKAVTMHIVTDPIYRSPMTTGLYLVPGEKATVTIKGLKKGETLTLYTHHQDTMGYKGYDENGSDRFHTTEEYFAYWDAKILEIAKAAEGTGKDPDFTKLSYGIHGQWVWQNQKVPCMGTKFNITGTDEETLTVEIGSMYGGPLYMNPTTDSVDLSITGAVLTPHFVLGVTTVDDFEKHYRNAPGLIATMDVENGQLIGPAVDMANADDIEKLAYFWHSVFAIDISLNGRQYNYNMTMCYDIHVPAGEAVALNSNFCAQPTYWFGTCMNYEKLTTSGNWGTFHELGHVQAKTYGENWGFCDGDGEVWNNTLILIIYSLLCNMDTRLTYVEHGDYAHPYLAVQRSIAVNREQTYEDKETGERKPIDDYGLLNEGSNAHFDQLSMYATLLHSFGPEKFIDMFYTYNIDPKFCDSKRADFVYRIGLVDRVNILDWVNSGYFANITDDMFSESQLAFLESLPTFYPIAYRWANGIDGNETARKYEVDGKHPTVFDLSDDNILSPKEFEILSVSEAQHGKAEYNAQTKKVTYTPPREVTEYDQFDIVVSAYGGRQVTLNVRFKLLYHGVHTEVWDLGTRDEKLLSTVSPTIDQAVNYIQDKPATSTETGSVPGKGTFDHKNLEYFKSTFTFRATKEGDHTFYLKADDAARVRFYKGQQSATGEVTKTLTASGKYDFSLTEDARKWKVTLNKGDTIFVVAELVNWGGKGYLNIGLAMPGDDYKEAKDIKDIPIANIINPGVTQEELAKADAFKGWQPQFVDSIKDVTMDYKEETTGWEILEAPLHDKENTKEHLIDGDVNTIYHSHYTNSSQKPQLPHVFVIDTKENHTFNFFEVLRRNNDNDQLFSYALYGMKDNGQEYDKDTMGGTNYEGWEKLFEGNSATPRAATQRISFEQRDLRWFKFVVTSNNGHTVIKELYAGLETELNQTVRPNAYASEEENNDFEENSANGKLTAETINAEFNFEFLGSGFELYSDTAPGYGTAQVTVDGHIAGTIDLNGKSIFNRCVFQSGDIGLGEHKVKVTTTSEKKFNISFINVVYGTPVDEEDYPALKNADGEEDYGDIDLPRLFTREWRTLVKDYKDLTSIKFVKEVPEGYEDTYRRIDEYIRIYRKGTEVAFVYPGTILSPAECGSLFAGCENLTAIAFENFDTSPMRGASSMFNGCRTLTALDLRTFKTENVQAMGSMFANCTNLCSLDLTSFTMAENVIITDLFDRCGSLVTIQLPEKVAEKAESLLPGIYRDETNNTYTYTVTKANAGHTLKLHDTHQFDEANRVAPKLPTCTEEGVRGYDVCSVCKFHFDPEANHELLTGENNAIAPLGHSTEWVLGKKMPNCTNDGDAMELICTRCREVLEVQGVIPALGHLLELDLSKGDGKGYTFHCNLGGTATVTFFFKCINYDYSYFDPEDLSSELPPCGGEVTVEVTIDSIEHTDATCTTNAQYIFRRVIDEQAILEALNPEGKKTPDNISYYQSVTIDETILLEGSLGHKYGAPTFAWESGNEKATATFVCEREGCPLDADGHTLTVDAEVTHLERVEATCLEDAHTRYSASAKASENGEVYTDVKVVKEEGSKKEHAYTGVYEQTADGKHHQKCVNGCQTFGPATDCTAQASWYQTEDNAGHYQLCVCGRRVSEGAHAYTVEMNWAGTQAEVGGTIAVSLHCSDCGTRVTDLNATIAEKAGSLHATCVSDGKIVYTASVEYGGKTYTADSPEYTASKLGHAYVPAESDPLTWAQDGKYNEAKLHLVCTNCKEGDVDHKKEITLPATVTTASGVNCGDRAESVGYKVDLSEAKILENIRRELGENSLDESKLEGIEALEYTATGTQVCHVWQLVEIEGSFRWSVAQDQNSATLTEKFQCERCGKEFTLTFEGEVHIVDATCEAAESITFTVTEKNIDDVKKTVEAGDYGVEFFAEDTFEALPRRDYTVERGAKLGHSYIEEKELPATCTQEGRKAGKYCSRCGETEGMEVIPAAGHRERAMEEVLPTCTSSGASGGAVCSVCGETIRSQTEVPALGHTRQENADGVAATCTAAGYTNSVSCSVCGETIEERRLIEAKGHTPHTLSDGKEATCTEEGRTDSVTCSVCGETLEASEVIPAGHKWEIVPGKSATATESGLTDGERCSVCGEVKTAQTVIPPLGKSGPNTAMIVGIVAGVAVVLAGGIVVICITAKKRRS